MHNKAMARKLETGDAIDVNVIGEQIIVGIMWELHNFLDGMDYCDAEQEQWIWSIGRRKDNGKFYAATTAMFRDHPEYDCVWLR